MTTIDEAIRDETLPRLDETEFSENAKRMMRAGIHLFARKGFAGTSVREIVKAADVTNPMLYYYFDNKAGLYNTLITYLFENITGAISQNLGETSSLVEAVDGIILAYFEACKASPVALRFVYMVLFGPEEAAPSFDVFEARQQMVDEIATLFDGAAERGDFVPNEQFDSVFLTERLLGLVNQYLMDAMKRVETYDDRAVRRERMAERMTPASAHDLREFFFHGAGDLTEQ